MKRIVFYYEEGIINDATSFYVDIIEKSAKKQNIKFTRTMSLKTISSGDIILTIYSKNFIESFITHPFNKTIFWAQGVEPEESRLHCNKIVYWIKSLMEYISIRLSSLLFMVSKSMYEHYQKKYRLKRNHYVIMPCYNADNIAEVSLSKYDRPTFVFAGGTSSWHCADAIIDTYKHIEDEFPNASITLLSNAKKQFKDILEKYNVKNYSINYVPLSELQDELSKYKYGFLLRDAHIINKVATPTKMSSYLGAGIIPVFTDAIDDFSTNINLGEYTLLYKTPIDTKEIASSIIKFEKAKHNYSQYLEIVKNVFSDYYCTAKYINIISKELKVLIK